MKKEIAERLIKIEHNMHELGINTFQCWGNPCKYINSLFGMENGKYKSCEYGIQSVHLLSNGKNCPPRIIVEYNKEGWQVNHNVVTDNYYRVLPQSTKENVYHIMTEQQEEGICTYFETLIRERKEQIEKAKNNPDFKVFSTYCVDIANEILKDTEYKCKLSYGKSQVDNVETWALVIYVGTKCNTYTQIGYIRIGRNKFNEYSFTCSTIGCRYSNSCANMDEIYPILKGMIKFLTN